MRDVLADIRSGAFARRWIDEWSSGGAGFKRMREEEGGHLIDEVGRGLRSRMAWLGQEDGAPSSPAGAPREAATSGDEAGAAAAPGAGRARERAVGR
jgi:ketol-acid reductoisomerase